MADQQNPSFINKPVGQTETIAEKQVPDATLNQNGVQSVSSNQNKKFLKLLVLIGLFTLALIILVVLIMVFSSSKKKSSSLTSRQSLQSEISASTEPKTSFIGKSNSHFGVNLIYQGLNQYSKQKGGTPLQFAKEFIDLEDSKLADMGIGWIRSAGEGDLTSFAWKKVEPQEGKFDFTLTDIRVKEAQVYGLNSLGIFEIQPNYQGHSGAIPDYGKSERFYFNEEKYLVYINKVVERYDGDGKDDMPGLTKPIKYWEVGNEIELPQMFSGTAEDYAHVLQISYEGVKATCPDCQVLIGGWVTGVNSPQLFQKSLNYLDIVLKTAGNYFDIMNFHQYADGADFMTYTHVSGFKDLLAKYNLTKPMWITESNTKLHKDKANGNLIEHTLAEQSQDIVKRFVIAFDAGVDVFFWHGLDESFSPNDPGVGLYNKNDQPNPIYYNLKYLIDKIGNFSAVKRIDLGDATNFYLYQFTVDNKSVFVLWTLGSDTALDLNRYFSQANLQMTYAITESGKTTGLNKQVNPKSVPFTQTPAFIEVSN